MGFYISREQIINAGKQVQSRTDQYLTVINDIIETSHGTSHHQMKYRGSGCYLSYDGFPFVLTAKHVIDSENVKHCIHSTSSGSKAFPFRDGWISPKDAGADVAIYGCFQQILDESGIQPLPYSELMVPSFNHHDAFYYCNGFPGATMLSLPFVGETSFVGNPFIGKQVSLPEGYNPEIHFAIEYPCTTDPYGMSGSPIWNLRFHCMNNFETWSPDAVSFAGVVHKWHKESQKLIVTNVEFVRDFVPKGILFLKKKYGWKNGNE